MIRIAHESPLDIMAKIRVRTDYDYCLVHLLDKYPEYLDFFRHSLRHGREVILDNSIFELGESFDMYQFAAWVSDLKPTYYIVPDVLENADGTIVNLYKWVDKHGNLGGKRIGVVQGKTYDEIKRCYKEIDKFCDVIAISFDYSFYKELFPSNSRFHSFSKGRRVLINQLLLDGIINTEKHHHLLGCSLPQEFKFYQNKRFSFIKSLDTSNPVVHGILNTRYKTFGLESKKTIKLVDLFEHKTTPKEYRNILHNIKIFNTFITGFITV